LTVPSVRAPVELGSVERHDFILLAVSFAIKQRTEELQRWHSTWSDLQRKAKLQMGCAQRKAC
jgi:hypothetical protein